MNITVPGDMWISWLWNVKGESHGNWIPETITEGLTTSYLTLIEVSLPLKQPKGNTTRSCSYATEAADCNKETKIREENLIWRIPVFVLNYYVLIPGLTVK